MNDVFKEIDAISGKIEPTFLERHWIFIVILIMTAAALTAFALLRKRKEASISPYELACIRLNAASDAADSKDYASAVSSAVRGYISEMFGIPAPERTTEEFLRLASASEKLSEKARAQIGEILAFSDMAKFAKLSFGEKEREKMSALARGFIEEDNAKRSEAKK